VRSSSESHEQHRAGLAVLGIPEPVRSQLAEYLDLVAGWNARTNLTAAQSATERVRILVADPWSAVEALRGGSLIDIGSGSGSPGLVLALLRPDLAVTLLEPRARRWAFLREAARALGRPDVGVLRVRSTEYSGLPASTVTIRAGSIDLGAVVGLVEPGGEVLIFGGEPSAPPSLVRVGSRRLAHGQLHIFKRFGG
jgi:16S rRNA (guanine527-N7)-methyltransferase